MTLLYKSQLLLTTQYHILLPQLMNSARDLKTLSVPVRGNTVAKLDRSHDLGHNDSYPYSTQPY